MADALFLLIIVAFFGLAVGFVRFCDSIIGPDADAPAGLTELDGPPAHDVTR